MEHLYKLLSRKKGLDIKDVIKNWKCTVSLKIDGNAFQISYDDIDGEVKYYKRSGSPEKVSPSKEITMYDCCFNDFYGDAILFFRDKEDILKNYDIINCEIIDKSHVIEYEEDEDRKIYLLSAIQDGDFLDEQQCKNLAEELGISSVSVIIDDEVLPKNISNAILKYKKDAEEFEGSVQELSSNNTMYQDVTKLLNAETDWDNQEGLVFVWNNNDESVSAKLNNPMFIDKWFDLQEEEEENIDMDFHEVSIILADTMENHLDELDSMRSDDYLENVLMLFSLFTQKEIADIYDSYTGEPKVNPAESKFVTMVYPELEEKLQNNVYQSVLNVLFIIMYKPKKRKTDLMDWDTQERINEIIDFLH